MTEIVELNPEPDRHGGDRGDERRSRILQALHDCIIDKGYAKTTLADIARVADMYPSHLLYYFRGKDAILEYYFQNVAEKFLERLEGFSNESAEKQIDQIAELFFSGAGLTISEIGFMLECFGVAVHHDELQRRKSELDKRCKACLYALFNKTPGVSTEAAAADSAEIAYAMLIGLRTAVYFDDQVELPGAHRLFHTTMRKLAGYTASS